MLLGRVKKRVNPNFSFVTPILYEWEIKEHFEETRDLTNAEKYREFEVFVKSKIGKAKKWKKEDDVFVHNTKCKPKSINEGDIVFLEAKKTKTVVVGKFTLWFGDSMNKIFFLLTKLIL